MARGSRGFSGGGEESCIRCRAGVRRGVPASAWIAVTHCSGAHRTPALINPGITLGGDERRPLSRSDAYGAADHQMAPTGRSSPGFPRGALEAN